MSYTVLSTLQFVENEGVDRSGTNVPILPHTKNNVTINYIVIDNNLIFILQFTFILHAGVKIDCDELMTMAFRLCYNYIQ